MSSRRSVPIVALAALVLLAGSVAPILPVARAQQPVTVVDDGWPTHQSNPFAQLVPRPAKLAPGDLIILTLYGLTAQGVATPFYLHVDANGGISVPLVGVVDVKDQTSDRAAARVSKAMADAGLVRDGVVTIGLLQTAEESGVSAGPFAAGDPLLVTIFDLVGNGRRLVSLAVVGNDGQIELPIAGAIKLEGLTEADADKAVQQRYRERQLLPNATVSVLKLAPPKAVEK